ncbi:MULTISPECIES: hypothetical protein [unclassified Streptomyces]
MARQDLPVVTSRALALVATVLMATTACSAPQVVTGGKSGGQDMDTRSSAAPSASASLPIEKFALTAQESHTVERAKVLLANECLRGFGLDYRIPEPSPLVVESSRRYGIADREVARDHGYHLPPQAGQADVAKQPTEAQKAILFGTNREGEQQTTSSDGRTIPPGGCYGDAEVQLNGGPLPESDIAVAATIDKESFKRSLDDKRVGQAFREWSTCVERHGYRYQDPMASVSDRAFDTEEPTQRERAVALADMDCKTEVGLLKTWGAVETEIQTRMVKNKSSTLNRLRSFQKRKMSNADEVIKRLSN